MVVKFLNQNTYFPLDIKRLVEVSIECHGIGELNTINESFQANLKIRSTWLTPIDEINDPKAYDPKVDWNPNLYIENTVSVQSQSIKYKLEKSIDSPEDYRITEIHQVSGTFWTKYELQNFPLDAQKLSVILTTKYGDNNISLVANPAEPSFINFEAVHIFRDQQKWHLFRHINIEESNRDFTNKKSDVAELKRRHSVFSLSHHLTEVIQKTQKIKPPQLYITFYAARKPGHIIYNGFALICIVMLMCLPPFAIDMRIIDKRLVCHLTLLLAMVTLKWVMNRDLPDSSQSTLLDKYILTSLVFNCCVMTWHAVGHVYGTNGYPPKPTTNIGLTLDTSFLLVFSGVYVLIQVVFGLLLWNAYSVIRKLYRSEAEYNEDSMGIFTNKNPNTHLE